MVDLSPIVNAEHEFTEHEHHELIRALGHIHAVGLAAGTVTRQDLADQLLSVLTWIDNTLVPHIRWEEEVVYRELDVRAGTHWATSVMRYEHGQLREFANALSRDYDELRHEPMSGQIGELRARLFGFEAVLRAHVQREEALLLPLMYR
jgi:hemerythrin-like domain-containing protein